MLAKPYFSPRRTFISRFPDASARHRDHDENEHGAPRLPRPPAPDEIAFFLRFGFAFARMCV